MQIGGLTICDEEAPAYLPHKRFMNIKQGSLGVTIAALRKSEKESVAAAAGIVLAGSRTSGSSTAGRGARRP
jgi:hypothetical protein